MNQRWRHAFAAGAMAFALTRTLSAQTVTGLVANSAQVPVPSALVLLLDSASTPVARALTNERGYYRLIAPTAGTYRLRVLRIGMRPELLAPFVLNAGDIVERAVTVASLALALDTVKVARQSVCALSTDTTVSTFTVWEQARTALTTASLTAGDRSVASKVLIYQRLLDPTSRRVVTQALATVTDSTATIWASAPLDSLRRRGYVVLEHEDSVIYRAPSLEAIASPEFVQDHCFRLERSDDSTQLGIAFEPTRLRRRIPDIAGTLWLDQRTAELRTAEFHYANVNQFPGAAVAGGRLDFARMADSSWRIARWSIRMPVMEQQTNTLNTASRIQAITRTVMTGVSEVGGELIETSRDGATVWTHSALPVRGTLLDSTTSTPIADAHIALLGTELQTLSDAAGRFEFPDVLPGEYTIEIRTASLDSLHAVQRMSASLLPASDPMTIPVISARDLAARMCPSADRNSSSQMRGMLIGSVLNAASNSGDSTTQANATISISWNDYTARDSKRMTTKTDARGNFRVCNVPVDQLLSVYAATNKSESEQLDVTIDADSRFASVNLALDTMNHATARLTGIVADSAGRPIPGVEIRMPDIGKSVLTDSAGAFRVSQIASGTQRVEMRKIGWTPLDTVLVFAPRSTINRRIIISRLTVLNTVETVAESFHMREFEENRRIGLGHFYTSADVDRLKPQTLSQLLTGTAGMQVIHAGNHAYVVNSRGTTSLSGRPCGISRHADVYLDGVRIYSGRASDSPFDINSINPAIIAGIEFYASAAQMPAKYNNLNSICGVLVIWSKR